MAPTARHPARLNARVRVRWSFLTSWSYRHWPLTRTPDCRVECASQLRPPKVGEVRKALREEKPAARSCASPRSSAASIRGERAESWTAIRQAIPHRLHLVDGQGGSARGGHRRADEAEGHPDHAERRRRPERPVAV